MHQYVAILVMLLASGCIGNPVSSPLPVIANTLVSEWTITDTELSCDYFCEPTIATDDAGTVFLLSERRLIAGPINGPFEPRTLPPVPSEAVPDSFQNDALLQVHADRLYLSALITHYSSDLQTLVLEGIQVASSNDGGKSWPHDTFVWLGSNPTTPALGSDRQWLTFDAADDVMYLSYQQAHAILGFDAPLGGVLEMLPKPEGNIQVATSLDRGGTFGNFVNAVGETERNSIQIVGLGESVDGRLFVPYYSYAQPPSSMVAISDDEGASFRQLQVGPVGDFFPRLLHAEDGLYYLAKSPDGILGMSRSTDGGETWTSSPQWEAAGVRASPWAERQVGLGLHVAWLEQANGTSYQLLYRNGTLDSPGRVEVIANLTAPDSARTYTDFLHFTLSPGGQPMIVYGDMKDGKIHVATRTLRVTSA